MICHARELAYYILFIIVFLPLLNCLEEAQIASVNCDLFQPRIQTRKLQFY